MVLILVASIFSSLPSYAQKEVKLRAIFDNLADHGRWDGLIEPAIEELNKRHPDMNIEFSYEEFPYSLTRDNILKTLSNHTPIDLLSVDQIWLGELADKGFLTDLSNNTKKWGRSADWYQESWGGGSYNQKIYGIWTWTDVRGIWYWKNMLRTANVDPNSLTSWEGYLTAANKLHKTLARNGTQSMYLVAASHSPDLWYPYLWMLGGQILQYKSGHPTKGSYWFPDYNSSAGVRALEFLKAQVAVGIKPQTDALHQEDDFANGKYAVSIDGSWVPGAFPTIKRENFEKTIGFLPVFPISLKESNQTATMMGGWELSIPQSSANKDLTWELITILEEPNILAPWLSKYGYLPTQSVIGEAIRSNSNYSNFPYYKEMISLIPFGHVRPNIPEYPLIAHDVQVAISDVLLRGKEPKEALQRAAFNSSKNLGW
jgi:multiple sugar transport system substrate-binding protein